MSQNKNIKFDINTGVYGWGEDVNNNFNIIDYLIFPVAADYVSGDLPVYKDSNTASECYIVNGSNNFGADINSILIPSKGSFITVVPKVGATVYLKTTKNYLSFDGSSWVLLNDILGFTELTKLTKEQTDKLVELNRLTNISINTVSDSLASIKLDISELQRQVSYTAKVVSDNKKSTDDSISSVSASLSMFASSTTSKIDNIKATYFLGSGATAVKDVVSSTDVSGTYNSVDGKYSIINFNSSIPLQLKTDSSGKIYTKIQDSSFDRVVTESGGVASSALRLNTTSNINGKGFDGTKDIDIDYLRSFQKGIKPSDVSNTKLTTMLLNLSEIDFTDKTDYCDTISLDSAGDDSKGLQNLLAISKKDRAIYHYVSNVWGGSSWVNKKQLAYIDSDIVGNSATTSKLKTPVKINNKDFDGSTDILIPPSSQLLTRGADLNSISDTGFYYCNSNNIALSIANKPETGAFSLLVEAGSIVKQTITNYDVGNTYVRVFNNVNNAWSNWRSVVFSDSDAANSSVTAQRLNTARRINSILFDGSKDITVYDDTKIPLSGADIQSPLRAGTLASYGDVTIDTGKIKTDDNHYIQLGKTLSDETIFATWGSRFVFKNTTDGSTNVVIDKNTITASSIQSTGDLILKTDGAKWIYLQSGAKSATFRGDGSLVAESFVGNLTGTSTYAGALSSARNIKLSGVVSGSVLFKGDNDVVINTTFTEGKQNSFLKSSTGYTEIGNGLILQWGSVDYDSAPGEKQDSCTFPIAFPNNCLQAVTTRIMSVHSSAGDVSANVISRSSTGLVVSLQTFNNNYIADSRGWTYIAIGY